jgi:hypothetical protein
MSTPESDPSLAIRAFEDAEAELRRVAQLTCEAYDEYERARTVMAGHGMRMQMEMPFPLHGGYPDWWRQQQAARVIELRADKRSA